MVVCRAFKGLGSVTSQISFMAWTRARPGDEIVLDGFTFTFSKAESVFFVLGIGLGGEGGLILLI